MSELIRFFRNIDPQFYVCIFGLIVTGIGIYNPLLLGLIGQKVCVKTLITLDIY